MQEMCLPRGSQAFASVSIERKYTFSFLSFYSCVVSLSLSLALWLSFFLSSSLGTWTSTVTHFVYSSTQQTIPPEELVPYETSPSF